MYGLGAGLWTRDAHEIYQVPRAIQAGRVWVNQYHAYPAGFGGYKQSALTRKSQNDVGALSSNQKYVDFI
jgi:aldehyde dehydrogenase